VCGYLVDPRVVTGTSWLTGANEPGRHAINVVAGRDFTPDGPIEAAEVRAGDACPNCVTGELTIRRGIEIGHIFQLGRRFADVFGLDALGPDSKPIRITMGSYGVGVSRLVAAIAEQHHDERGLVWPAAVAPADVHVVAAGKGDQLAGALRIGEELAARGLDVIVDDRTGVSVGGEVHRRRTDRCPHHGGRWPPSCRGFVEVRRRGANTQEDVLVGELFDKL